MDHDKLADELAPKKAEVHILRQISLEINSTLILDEILDIALRTMAELFGFHHSIILLPDSTGESLTVVASRGYDVPVLGARVAFGTGIIGVVAKRRKLMRASNLSQQRRYASAIRKQMKQAGRADELDEVVKVPGLADVESQIAIPLLIKGELIGVFSVESSEQRVFSEREEILVNIVANQAASAIHNAQLYADQQRRRDELAEAHDRLQQLNETLEIRVSDRTKELEQANRDLRETQAHLVQSGKMASLGMLAAGIVHEINTPIGAIHSNADVQTRTINIIQEALKEPAFAERVSERPRLERALSVLQTTNSMTQEAVSRIVKMIRSLKSFARLDQAKLESVDLHEGLDSTLILLQHLLKDRIKVVKNYGRLPSVRCYASQVNQVFMNLLTNAAQAIKDDGTITITTRLDGKCAVVEVADTGSGIAPDHLKRVFDPGFTTRGVGVGAGLGLPITYRIVEDHCGKIDIQSELGKGTIISVKLPIAPPEEANAT